SLRRCQGSSPLPYTTLFRSGVGSCIMGAIDRPALCDLFGTAPSLRLHSMVAFGYPAHESRVVEMRDGDVRYYLDDARDYCVPKRSEEHTSELQSRFDLVCRL